MKNWPAFVTRVIKIHSLDTMNRPFLPKLPKFTSVVVLTTQRCQVHGGASGRITEIISIPLLGTKNEVFSKFNFNHSVAE